MWKNGLFWAIVENFFFLCRNHRFFERINPAKIALKRMKAEV